MELSLINKQKTANPVLAGLAVIHLSGVEPPNSANEILRVSETIKSAAIGTGELPRNSAQTALQEGFDRVREAIRNANQAYPNRIRFDIDDQTGQVIVRVIDNNTQEVVRQIPPEEFLRIAEKIQVLNHPHIGAVLDQTS